MNRKFFVCLISVTIISSMMSSGYAQSTLNVRVFIEGFYDSTQNKMVPVIDAVNTPTLFDTVTVNLHSTIDLSIAFTEKVILDINGNGTVILPAPLFNNSYYLDIRHRNSLQTWSSLPLLITSVVNYDFTTAKSQAYGNNQNWVGNAACIYSGDFNQDEYTDLSDFPYWDDQSSNSPYGYYLLTDVTGDSISDLLDFYFWDKNNTNFVYSIHPYAVNINNLEESNLIHIFPNPSNSILSIDISDIYTEAILIIFSLSGAEIEKISINRDELNIDVSKYPAGIYLINCINGKIEYTRKFVVEH